MPKPVTKRVSDSFGDDSVAEAKEYLSLLSDAWKDVTATLTRQTIFLFLLMGLFELLVYQRKEAQITIGSISIAGTSVIVIFLPTVIAYLIYDEFHLSARWTDINNAYYTIYTKIWPNQNENDLAEFVTPKLPGLWRIGTSVSSENAMPSERFIFSVDRIVSVVAGLFLPFAFEVQAYIVLFTKFGFVNIFLWINVFICFSLVFATVKYLSLYAAE